MCNGSKFLSAYSVRLFYLSFLTTQRNQTIVLDIMAYIHIFGFMPQVRTGIFQAVLIENLAFSVNLSRGEFQLFFFTTLFEVDAQTSHSAPYRHNVQSYLQSITSHFVKLVPNTVVSSAAISFIHEH